MMIRAILGFVISIMGGELLDQAALSDWPNHACTSAASRSAWATPKGARVSVIIYTIVEMAKAHDLNIERS